MSVVLVGSECLLDSSPPDRPELNKPGPLAASLGTRRFADPEDGASPVYFLVNDAFSPVGSDGDWQGDPGERRVEGRSSWV